MSKLICNFEEFNAKKNNITNLIETYKTLLSSVISVSEEGSQYWISDSQSIFYNKLLERKVDLDKLSENLEQINSFLNEVINTYQNIESKYS